MSRQSAWDALQQMRDRGVLFLHPTVFPEDTLRRVLAYQYRHFQLYQHLPQLFTTQHVNQISQSLSRLFAQIVTFPRNPQRIFAMYININMSLVSSVSECAISLLPGTCAYSVHFDFLRRSFLQMPLCETWNPHGIFFLASLIQACSTTPLTPLHNILRLHGPSNSTVFTQQLPSLPITSPWHIPARFYNGALTRTLFLPLLTLHPFVLHPGRPLVLARKGCMFPLF